MTNAENSISPEAIYTNDTLYRFLIYYFLDDLSDPYLITGIDSSPDIRWTLSQAMASWLPYEKHYPQILQRIEDLRAAASNGKTDA